MANDFRDQQVNLILPTARKNWDMVIEPINQFANAAEI